MNNIDKIFRNKLEHHHADIPDKAWANIEARLNESPKPKNNFFPVGMMLLGLFLVSFGGYLSMNDDHLFGKIPASSSMDNRQQNRMASTTSVIPEVSKEISFSQINLPTENKQIRFLNAEKPVPAVSEAKQRTTTTLYKSPDNSFSQSQAEAESMPSTGMSPERMLIEQTSNNIKTEIFRQHTSEISYLDNALNNNKLKFFRSIRLPSIFAKDKPVKACPFVYDYQNKSVDVYVSHDYSPKQLSANDSELNTHIDMRNQTEKALYSFSAGFRFGYNLSYKWNLHTGFNYSQTNEKFEYIDPESNQTRIIIIKDYVYQNGKIIDSIITQETVTVPGTTKLKVFNKYRSYDIPVLARYTLFANHHLSLSAMAGVYLNVATRQKGMILDLDNKTPVEIYVKEKQDNNLFKTQLGVSGYASFSMAYHLTSNVDFLLEPNVRFQPESLSSNHYAVSQKMNTFGVSTGLRYKF